jgi:hypothetical protein
MHHEDVVGTLVQGKSPVVHANQTYIQLCRRATIDSHDHCVDASARPCSCIASIVVRRSDDVEDKGAKHLAYKRGTVQVAAAHKGG